MAVQRAAHDDDSGPVFDVMLTPREREVLLMLADGFSAKEVALKLNITSRTVESHIDKLRLKTRSRNRTHMVAQAIQLGLL
jgi:DNA-binding CsgD family transcriptional regulator